MSSVSQLLKVPAPPSLPYSPKEYDTKFQEAYSNILRVYFTQISNALQATLKPLGGQYVDCPNGLFFDLGNYTPGAINTGYPLHFEQSYLSNGIRVVDHTKITVSVGGVYNFQYSSAVTSSDFSVKTVWVWIVRNGVPVGYSTNAYTISGAGTATIIAWNFNIDLDAGEYIELYWGADNTNVAISTTAPAVPHTGIPANVVAVNFIAPLPNPRPTPP